MKTRQMQTYRGRRRAAAAAAAAAAASGLPCLDQSGRLVDQSAISFDSKRPYRVSLAKLGFVGWFVLFVCFFFGDKNPRKTGNVGGTSDTRSEEK